jgi:DNA-binding CsgD family transcriptional regulator
MPVPNAIESALTFFSRKAWQDAYDAFTIAESQAPLSGLHLEQFAVSAFMLGSEDGFISIVGRAHLAYEGANALPDAIRTSAWAGIGHLQRGEVGPATGWFRRGQRLADRLDGEHVERAYLLMPEAIRASLEGAHELASEVSRRVAESAQRAGEHDLFALAVCEEGRAHIRGGRPAIGVPLLDEAMVTVTTCDVSPMVAGIVYCSVIEGCHEGFALGRAIEWTEALRRWCDDQTDLVRFTGRCHVHQAEILQMHGAWDDAVEQAQRSRRRFEDVEHSNASRAYLRLADLHRLSGRQSEAEEAYEQAGRLGGDPQPGLALLRLGERRTGIAVTSINRALAETHGAMDRARLLPASVEIHVAAGEIDDAETLASELRSLADEADSTILSAHADVAVALVALERQNPGLALPLLRRAAEVWRGLDAVYDEACTRVSIGRACMALDDHHGAALEFAAARNVFERLGALPALGFLRSVTAQGMEMHGLSDRELEVLRLVAAGHTNRQIADQLFLSVKTIDRHLSNIFSKLGVGSRTSATAFAYEHDLL